MFLRCTVIVQQRSRLVFFFCLSVTINLIAHQLGTIVSKKLVFTVPVANKMSIATALHKIPLVSTKLSLHPTTQSSICAAVLVIALVACTVAGAVAPTQPTFNATRQSVINTAGTYVVDGLSVDTNNGLRIFPNLTKSYSLIIDVQAGNVSLVVERGILLDVLNIRATNFHAIVTTAASVSFQINDVVDNVDVEIVDGGIVRTIHAATSNSLKSLAVNANNSFIGDKESVFLVVDNAPSCVTTLNFVNTSNPPISQWWLAALVSGSGGLGDLMITMAAGSQFTFINPFLQCIECANISLHLLSMSVLTMWSSGGLYVASSTSVRVVVDNATMHLEGNMVNASGVSDDVSITITNATVKHLVFLYPSLEVDGDFILVSLWNCTHATINISDASVQAVRIGYAFNVSNVVISMLNSNITTFFSPYELEYPTVSTTTTTTVVVLAVRSCTIFSRFDSSLLSISNVATFPTASSSSIVLQNNNFGGAWSSLLRMNISNLAVVSSGLYLTTTIALNTIDSVIGLNSFAFVEGWPRQGLTVRQNSARIVVGSVTLVSTAIILNNLPATSAKLFVVGNNVTTEMSSPPLPALQTAGSGCTTVSSDTAATAICWNTIIVVGASNGTSNIVGRVVLLSNGVCNHASSLLADNTVNINNCGERCGNVSVVFFPTLAISTRASVFRNIMNIESGSTVATWSFFDRLNTTVAMTVVGSAIMSFPTATISSTLCNSYSSSTASTVLCANVVNLKANASLVKGSVIRNSSIGTLSAAPVLNLQAAPTGQASASIGQFDFFYLSNATSFTVSSLTLTSQLSAAIRLLRSSLVLGSVTFAQSLTVTFTDTSSVGVNFTFAFIEDLKYSTALTMSSLSISMNTLNGNATTAICLKCFVKDNVAVKNNNIAITNSPIATASIAGIIFGTLPEYDTVATTSAKTGVVRGNLLIVAPTGVNPSGSASCPSGADICGNTLSLKGTGVSNVTVCPGCGTQDPKWTVTVSNNVFGIQSTTSLVTVALCPGCIAWNAGVVRVFNQNFTVTGVYDFMMNFGGLDVKNGTGVVQWNQVRASPANVSQILDASWFGECSTIPANVSAICGNSAIVNLLSVDREANLVSRTRWNTLITQQAGAVFCSNCTARENATLSVVNNYFESFNTTGARVVVCDDCHASGDNMRVTNATSLTDILATTWNRLTVSNNTVITRKGPPSANYVYLYGSSYLSTVYATTAIYKHNITLCSRCTATNGGSLQLFSNAYTHLLDDGRYDNFSSYRNGILQINQINVTLCHQCNSTGPEAMIALYNNTATAEGQYYGGMRGCAQCAVNESGRIIIASNLITVAGGYGTVDAFNAERLNVGANATVRIARNYKNTYRYNSLSTMQAQVDAALPSCNVEFALNRNDSIICGNVFAAISTNWGYTPTWFNLEVCLFCNASHPELTNEETLTNEKLVHVSISKNRELIIANNTWTIWYSNHRTYFGEQCIGNVWITGNKLTLNSISTLDFSFCENCTVSPSVNGTNVFRVEFNSVTGVASTSTVALASYKSHHGVIVCNNTMQTQYYTFQAPQLLNNASRIDVVCIIPNSTWSHTTNNSVLITSSATSSQILCRSCFTRGIGSIQVHNHTFLSTVYSSTTLTLCMNCHVSINGELLILNNIYYLMYSSTVNIFFNNQMNSQSSHRAINNEILAGSSLDEVRDSGYAAMKHHREDLLQYCLSRALNTTPMGNKESQLRLDKEMSQYGSLVCGNQFFILQSSYLNVVAVKSLDVVQGLTHYVENNTLTTRSSIYSVTLQWCYFCNVYTAPLRVAHNYAQLSGSQYVTVFFTGVRISYKTSQVHTITNNNFIGTSDYSLSNPEDIAFATEVLQRSANASELWNVESGTVNNTVVAVNNLYGATVSLCRGCQVAQGATMLIVKNEIRRSNSFTSSSFTDAISLCQECTFANSGVFRIWNNSVDVRNSSTVEFVGLRDFDTYTAPFRVHRNAFIGFNSSVLPRQFSATCGDYNTSEINDDIFVQQEMCGNVMRAKNAVQLSSYLVRGLYARSSVLVDINTVIQQDATTAYTYGCDGCFGEPMKQLIFVDPYVEGVEDVISIASPISPPSNNSTTTTTTHSLSPSHSHLQSATTATTKSGVLVNRNVMEVLRYTYVTHRLLSGGVTNNSAYTAWNNTLYTTSTQRVAVTMLHYTLCLNSVVLVAKNLVTDNADAANAVINNVTGSLDDMDDFCPVGVCGNTALLIGAQTSFSTFAYGPSARQVNVVSNQVLLDGIYSAYATFVANSTVAYATVIDNNVTATTSIATVLATESVQTANGQYGYFTLANNVVNATGRTSASYPSTIPGSAPCALPNGNYTVVCQNIFALRTDSFSAVLARSVSVYRDVVLKSNAIVASGVQNATAFVGQSIQTGSQGVGLAALTIEGNLIAMENMGDFTDTQDTCSTRCGAGIRAAQQAYIKNGTAPVLSMITTNATMAASICFLCNANYGALSVQNNGVTLQKAQRYHCNHCLGRVDLSLSTSLASIHSGFTGRPQNTLAPSLVDAVIYTGSSLGASTTIKNNYITLDELDVSTCDATDFSGVCPSFHQSTYTANLVRAVVMGFGSYDSNINVQSNTIRANVTANNSFLLGSTAMVAVQVSAKPTTAIMTVQSNTMTLQGGSPQAFVCGGISDVSQASYAISITGNTATAYGNETSIAVCLGCSVSYQSLTLTSNTLTAGKGEYGNGAICAKCSANQNAIKFGVQDNVLAFTNVDTFRGIIAYLVSAYGTDVVIRDNAIGASSGTSPTFSLSQTCPNTDFYICHNTIRASYVTSVANTTICGGCSMSSSSSSASLSATYNQVNVNSVPSSYTVFYDGTLSGSRTVASTSNVQGNTVTIQNVVNTSIVPFQVSSSMATALVANNIFDLNNAGSFVRGYLVGGPASPSGSGSDTTCIKNNVITTSDSAGILSGASALSGCNTSIVSNTIRVYNGTGLGGWSLMGQTSVDAVWHGADRYSHQPTPAHSSTDDAGTKQLVTCQYHHRAIDATYLECGRCVARQGSSMQHQHTAEFEVQRWLRLPMGRRQWTLSLTTALQRNQSFLSRLLEETHALCGGVSSKQAQEGHISALRRLQFERRCMHLSTTGTLQREPTGPSPCRSHTQRTTRGHLNTPRTRRRCIPQKKWWKTERRVSGRSRRLPTTQGVSFVGGAQDP
ncbi:membrane-associated protein, putative [Bodo saltans]|uniref:Membrane-associated protein, putative n=1 Tax=Bodo saltans TaxID=75058 RepID=A0A0S4JV10_BODSA|nr:membrane-associated protein, putative [Bodo saltans]|eukprot:CUG92413.1 membrane-associated protein, putative [Bodo saltans]